MAYVFVDLDELPDEVASYVSQVSTPIVMCKDCKHCAPIMCRDCKHCELITDDLLYSGSHRCKAHGDQLVDDLNWYCADAERRQ